MNYSDYIIELEEHRLASYKFEKQLHDAEEAASYLKSLFSISNTAEQDARAIIDLIGTREKSAKIGISVATSIDIFLRSCGKETEDFIEDVMDGDWPTFHSRLRADKADELRMIAEAFLI